MKVNNFKPKQDDKMWQGFMILIKDGGWNYLQHMAKLYRADTANLLVSINVCPSCESKLSRKYVDGKTINSCHTCNNAWELLEK
ncbi:hypothetical protein ACFLWZ_05195, partial [Chloroflexota bacterium]